MVRRQLGTRVTRGIQEGRVVEVVDKMMQTPTSDRSVFPAAVDGEDGLAAVQGQRG
jgi:hypothetical protein